MASVPTDAPSSKLKSAVQDPPLILHKKNPFVINIYLIVYTLLPRPYQSENKAMQLSVKSAILLLSTQLCKQDNREFQVYSHICILQSLQTSKKQEYLKWN